MPCPRSAINCRNSSTSNYVRAVDVATGLIKIFQLANIDYVQGISP
ncbi:MAG: hypothetical protein AB1776_08570 [Bacillota bacterium]